MMLLGLYFTVRLLTAQQDMARPEGQSQLPLNSNVVPRRLPGDIR
jgi:hypothetical protein